MNVPLSSDECIHKLTIACFRFSFFNRRYVMDAPILQMGLELLQAVDRATAPSLTGRAVPPPKPLVISMDERR